MADDGESVVVAAAAAGVGRLRARRLAVVLRGWVPDLPEEVVAPARASGNPDAATAALAGSLPDLRSLVS